MAIGKDILDQLPAGRGPQGVFSRDGPADELRKALSERIPNTGLDERPGGERQEGRPDRRNGSSAEDGADRRLEGDARHPPGPGGDV